MVRQARRAREEEELSQDVNRQCRSRNRTKHIYINSLLYNHDKRKKFTQKYKFEIINSTSVSDNSFFPPLHKVQSCIVLKAIYESRRRVGRREGHVAGNCHTVVLENHKAEDEG